MTKEWDEDADLSEFGGPSVEEKEKLEKEIMKKFRKSIQKRDDGYYVRFPWKGENRTIPTNWAIAIRRLKSVMKQYGSDEWVISQYKQIFADQLEKEVIEEVNLECKHAEESTVVHYLAHQPVITPQKETTKVRIVFDASAHFKGAPSLNDTIHQGPTMLPLIMGMLLRFRTGTIAVISDVEKAFLQVKLQEKDRDATRFLWVKDAERPVNEENIVTYRYRTIPFGINASPFLLAATINHHLRKSGDSKFAEQIIENTYVDNVIYTCNSVSEGSEFYKAAKREFNELKMNLREFLSNDTDINGLLAEKDRAQNAEPKVLGMKWISSNDRIELAAKIKTIEKLTKRTVASQTAAVYDPLGLLGPLLLPAKKYQQKLWNNYGWDDLLDEEEVSEWRHISGNIDGFVKHLPRSITSISSIVDLIICSDANADTMSSCGYLISSGNSHLVMSKTKLRSLKTKATIPKMEFNAYLMGMDLAMNIYVEMLSKVKIRKVIALTDSEITRCWTQSVKAPTDAGIYVERRWRKFRELAEKFLYQKIPIFIGYINTKENPADVATRGVTKNEFDDHIWWTGPRYFTDDIENWPDYCKIAPLTKESNVEESNIVLIAETKNIDEIIPWKRTNSLRKLANIVGYVMRFVRHCLQRLPDHTKAKFAHLQLGFRSSGVNLTAKEIKIARETIIRSHQQEADTEGRLKELKHLDLFKDERNIWRCGGRLRRAELPDATKFPILVDSKSLFAQLIVREEHSTLGQRSLHRSNRSTTSAVREKYWIPSLRRIVRKIIGKCVECERYTNAPFPYPNTPDLPTRRVVRVVTCDNAPTFLQGSNILNELITDEQENDDFARFFAEKQIEWKRITPYSPWQGGFYERLIQDVKRCFYKATKRTLLNYVDLITIFTEIEADG
ncbi:hypothetical protein QR680_009259 [Steinernema hermaphroditum]|uniref:Integrase catalytic domain-containing protein n=1 Tax=Steinernema hermaphroditum TaxID=289476 RepID=A0AA39ILR1_9BILA|nr:hypothetical protein QR680_009259 [Steinernema hermaphroditum]